MPSLKLLLTLTTLLSCDAFAPRVAKVQHRPSTTAAFADKQFNVDDLTSKAKDLAGNLQNIDISGITNNADAIRDNVFGGEFGERGEVYVAVQVALGLCILGGGIPVVGSLLMLILGPGFLIGGLAIIALSVNDLGGALSPWPAPAANTELKTDGLYAEMRHPIYAGLLYACLGLSITTGSAVRLLLTAAFLYALEIKSDYEEKELAKMFPDYAAYKEKVSSKFIPETVTENLPWLD